jgi:hypothetical protein
MKGGFQRLFVQMVSASGNLFVSDVLELSMLLNRQNSSRKFLFLAQGRRLEGGQSMSAPARVFQKSTCSTIAKASSTSMPKYPTVLSILVMSEQEVDGPEISQIRNVSSILKNSKSGGARPSIGIIIHQDEMKTGDRGAESKMGATASDQNNQGCLRRDTTLDHIQHMLNI